MDINLLLDRGMMACGRVLKVLPKNGEDGIGSPKKYMLKVLRIRTLPTLDDLYPIIFRKTISTGSLIPYAENEYNRNISDMETRVITDDRYYKFRIPSEVVDGHKIISLKGCVPVYATAGGLTGSGVSVGYESRVYGNKWGRTSSADLYGAAWSNMLNYADRQLMGTMKRNFRFYFFQPNILAVTEPGSLCIDFCLGNDENLISVDEGATENAGRLFVYDLRTAIYNEYGNYVEISTPEGDYNMNTGDWASAEDQRNTLYNELRAKRHFRTSSMRS